MAEEYVTYTNGLPPCPYGRCDGSGWILNEDNTATKCDCLEPRLARARASGINSVIPKRFRGVSFDRPPVTEMSDIVVGPIRTWVDSTDENIRKGHGLWISGDLGTGKTTLAMLVSKEAVKRGYTVAIYSMPKLLANIRASFGAVNPQDSYANLLEQLCNVDLLHIDDLGAEKQTEWVLEQLYVLLNERYERQKSVIVTTNLQQVQLEEQMGARSVSRLIEICGENQILIMGKDVRFSVPPTDG